MADKNKQKKQTNDKVQLEYDRLIEIFKDIPRDKMSVVDGLVTQAARLRVMLDGAWLDIVDNGDYEEFTQSPSTPAYERERPVAKLFNQRDAAYQKIIFQLVKLLPEEKVDEVKAEFNAGDII